MNNKKFVLVMVFAVMALLVFAISRGNNAGHKSTTDGVAPEVKVFDLRGTPVPPSELRGKVLFINIWASWCAPCKEEMPSIEALYREMSSSNDFRMITILFNDSPEVAMEHMKSMGYTFPVYADPDGETARNYGVTGVPETFLVDKKGMLVKRVIGGMDWNSKEVKDYLQTLLKE